jgi:hypothetical protein
MIYKLGCRWMEVDRLPALSTLLPEIKLELAAGAGLIVSEKR